MTLKSTAGSANFKVEAGGSHNAVIKIEAPANNDAKIELWEGASGSGKVFEILNDGSSDKLKISDGTYDLLTMTRITGEITNRGDMTIGGEGTAGPKVFTVKSMDAASSIMVHAGGTANALFDIKAPSGRDAMVRLTEGNQTFQIANQGSQGKLIIDDGSNELVSVQRATGTTTLRGDLTVGMANGTRAATIVSQNAAATLAVVSGGSGVATVQAESPSGVDSRLRLSQGAQHFDVAHSASQSKLVVNDGSHDLVSVTRGTGAMHVRGDLTVGGDSGAQAAD
jgi:hypothetical protein